MNPLYQQVEKAIRDHTLQMSVPKGTTQDDVYQCIRRIMCENPDIFWFSNQWKYSEKEQSVCFHYTISKERSIKDKKQIDDVIQKDFNIEVVRHLPVLLQVMYTYKWLALYCNYNLYSAYNQTIYSVFVHRNSVCTGYAKAAQYLYKKLGIDSKLVFGTLHNTDKKSHHCWLMICINGQWYHQDPTFAVPEISVLLQNAGIKPTFGAEGLVYNYFCCNTESIKRSRVIEDECKQPVCSSTIDSKPLQDIPIHVHRTEDAEQLGVRGCLLSDNGSNSDVYLWHSEKMVQSVVKIYKNKFSQELLHHEYQMMHQLSSSNHVLHALGVTDSQDGIVIEQATSLADLMCCHYYQLSAKHFCKLLSDVIDGLQDCIQYGIYYRDIHLENIYRTSMGNYVLGDFGSCVWINRENSSNLGGIDNPWYLAPETYFSGVFNELSATYGVGMIAYCLLNNLFPPLWNEYGRDSLYLRINGYGLPFPILLNNPSCEFELQMAFAIQKSLSLGLADRYQSLSELKDAIKQCESLVEQDDYPLIDGVSKERLFKNETIITNVSSFSGVCASYKQFEKPLGILFGKDSHRSNYNRKGCPSSNISISHNTCLPEFGNDSSYKDKSKKSIWSRLFRKKKEKEDEVYGSIFAPQEVKPNSHLLVQVYLHLLEEADKVQQWAKEADSEAKRRKYGSLNTKLKYGDNVKVEFNLYGESLLFNATKEVTWHGHFTQCCFDYFIPCNFKLNNLSCEVNFFVNGAIIGNMTFITRIVKQPGMTLNSKIKTHVFKRVFISYAHQDSKRAKDFALAYKAQGTDYFYDRDKLAAGDVYEEKIFEYIDSADLFILCWSENASRSEYVWKELKRAMLHAYPQLSMNDATLKIYPISIEPRTSLPEDMAGIYNFEEV